VAFGGVVEFETYFFADLLHAVVVGHDFGGDAGELFVAANLNEALEQLGA
jgi:hypothetical protein